VRRAERDSSASNQSTAMKTYTICAKCRAVEFAPGCWATETFKIPEADCTHGICPRCREAYRAELAKLKPEAKP